MAYTEKYYRPPQQHSQHEAYDIIPNGLHVHTMSDADEIQLTPTGTGSAQARAPGASGATTHTATQTNGAPSAAETTSFKWTSLRSVVDLLSPGDNSFGGTVSDKYLDSITLIAGFFVIATFPGLLVIFLMATPVGSFAIMPLWAVVFTAINTRSARRR